LVVKSAAVDCADMGESSRTNLTVPGNSYTGQAAASIECSTTNGSNTVRDGYIGQAAAARECRLTNGNNTIRDGYIGQAAAAGKCSTANVRDTVRDNHAGQVTAVSECTITNGSNRFTILLLRQNYNPRKFFLVPIISCDGPACFVFFKVIGNIGFREGG